MKKLVLIIEGMTEAEVLAAMSRPDIAALFAVLSMELGADQAFFGAGKSASLSEVAPHFDRAAASMN